MIDLLQVVIIVLPVAGWQARFLLDVVHILQLVDGFVQFIFNSNKVLSKRSEQWQKLQNLRVLPVWLKPEGLGVIAVLHLVYSNIIVI